MKNMTRKINTVMKNLNSNPKKECAKSINSKIVKKSLKNQGLKIDNKNIFIKKCVEKVREIARVFKNFTKKMK